MLQRDHIIAYMTTLTSVRPLLPGYLLQDLQANPLHGILMAAASGSIELLIKPIEQAKPADQEDGQ